MKKGKIRVLALCVFERNGSILVAENYDRMKRQTFYRPLGGGVEFGERGADAVVREIREELSTAMRDVRYVGALENIFEFEGKPGHEVVLVYDAAFVDASLYERASLEGREGDDPFTAVWKPLSSFPNEQAPLYPDGLLELLTRRDADAL